MLTRVYAVRTKADCLGSEVRSMAAIKELSAYKVQSQTDPDKWYDVIIDWDRTPVVSCNCADYAQNDKVCDHIEEAQTLYLYREYLR